MSRITRVGLLLTALLGVAVLGACGSSDDGPGVATAGGDTPVATPTATADADRAEQLRQFAQCMRDNGVNVSDPDLSAGLRGVAGMANGLDANDPKVQAAFTTCQAKLPNGGEPPKLNPEQLEAYRVFAQCVRDNGYENLPDPAADGSMQLNASMLGALQDPAFQKAFEACRDTLTGLVRAVPSQS